MLTLDEVIKAIGELTACDDTGYSYIADGDADDALHYLKMYRSDMIQYEADRKYWQEEMTQVMDQYNSARDKHIKELKELKQNDPLTWDELKQMEGKPVWIEEKGYYQTWEYWSLVYWMNDDELTLWNENGRTTYSKNEQGTVWQAYRKERTDANR